MSKRIASTKRAPGGSLEEHRERARRFGFLKRRLGAVNVEQVWNELERDLVIGDRRRRPEAILEALDRGETNHTRAAMLFRVAVEEREELRLDFRACYSKWELDARSSIEKDKKERKLAGQTTAAMVEDRIAATVPEFRDWKIAMKVLDRNVALTEAMMNNWESRRSTLRHMSKAIELRSSTGGGSNEKVDPAMLDRRKRNRDDEDEGDTE